MDTSGIITTFAGNGSAGFSGDGGPADEAEFNFGGRGDVAVDGWGNVYVADCGNHRIRMVNTDGIVTTVAGNGVAGFSGDGGLAAESSLCDPCGLDVVYWGTLYIADSGNNRIRMVDSSGVIWTVAGTGDAGFWGDGGPATSAELWYPVDVSKRGSLFIADLGNLRVRRVDQGGIITTVAGNGLLSPSFKEVSEQGPRGMLLYPSAVAVDDSGTIFVTDTGHHQVKKLDAAGWSVVVGTGEWGFGGDGGPATSALLSTPYGLVIAGDGSLLFSDFDNHCIRRVGPDGIITTIAGMGTPGFSGDGGPALRCQLYYPSALTVNSSGDVYVADSGNHRVRVIDTNGIITTVAGNGIPEFAGDGGPATEASLHDPCGLSIDGAGRVYIADPWNNRIRRVNTDGIITTVAGNGIAGFSGDGGQASQARLISPNVIQ